MPKRYREPPLPNQNSEERVREILEDWSIGGVKISDCEVCGHPMLGKRHASCQ